MTDEKADNEPTLVERWIQEQQEWQKTATAYFDSLVKNDDFLVHIGNAMRGSLLAGKPYPGTQAPGAQGPGTQTTEAATETVAADDRIDDYLHALHRNQGEIADLRMTVAELAARLPVAAAAPLAPAPEPAQSGGRARGET
jgi:hypothetical protein